MVAKYEGCPTTRRYARSLREAFPDDGVNGEWFHPPEKSWQDRLMFWSGVTMWSGLGIYFWVAL